MEKSRSFPSAVNSTSFGCCDEAAAAAKSNSYSFNGPRSGPTDPELKRKRRVASYNVFTLEGKLKSSVRSTFKWLKSKLNSDPRYTN